ncbi:hypothetical protein BH09PAT2_BH09PAT2_01020 [soil metagenome]
MINEKDFTYCPHCATKFVVDGDHLSCPKCKLQYYVNPKPTNAVLLKNGKDELLLVKRKHDPKKGYWDLPGGFINTGETAEESVHREVEEELKIRISDIHYLCSFYDTYEFGEIKAHTICFLFEAKMINPEVMNPSDDVESFKYFDTKNLPYDSFAFPPMRDALLRLYSLKNP